MMYIRDGCRMVSDYVITEEDTALNDSPAPQVFARVGVADCPPDTHCARRVISHVRVHNEGFVFKDGFQWRPGVDLNYLWMQQRHDSLAFTYLDGASAAILHSDARGRPVRPAHPPLVRSALMSSRHCRPCAWPTFPIGPVTTLCAPGSSAIKLGKHVPTAVSLSKKFPRPPTL